MPTTRSLQVDDLVFEVRRSKGRRTLQITVDRGGELILTAPPDAKVAVLRQFVKEKLFWVYTKLAEKGRLHKPVVPKSYVDGEGFLYLGRSYRLKLVDHQDVPLKLTGGRFNLLGTEMQNAREHFVRWYAERAKAWLTGRVLEFADGMGVSPTSIKVQDLGFRWGSCGKGGKLYFHWKTILLPARIAEYVTIHEMAHLHVPHHTPAFWLRVEHALPGYAQHKAWLAEHGMDVEGI
ncbi:MAG: M48 family metallopeptidase [Fibrobacteres bacterium]|nr:M48 family metallopeptidase [Fibrobacterota bacterium]QQS07681.1 MAG: M48 family metallopeptidase [Fibrobacterota bacterium]